MERAVRMIFANVMFDTWLNAGNGMNALRPGIINMVRRLTVETVIQNPEITEHAGLITVHCQKFTADTETLRHERGCAIFSIRSDGQPGRGIPFSDGRRADQPFRPSESPPAPALPPQVETAGMDDSGPLFAPPTGDDTHLPVNPRVLPTAPVSWGLDTGNITPVEIDNLASMAIGSGKKTRTFTIFPVDPRGRLPIFHRMVLHTCGSDYQGKPDQQTGGVSFSIPVGAGSGRLTMVLSPEPGHLLCWPVRFASLPSEKCCAGLRARLHLLGFDSGSMNECFDVGLALAVQAFQKKMGLPRTDGVMDQATGDCLEKLFRHESVAPAMES